MKVMMAGGGTGGHIFPALAVAEELRRRNPQHEIVFVGTQNGLESRLVPAAGYPLRTLRAAGFAGVGAAGKLRSLWLLPQGLWQSRSLLRELAPAVVFGVGGYAAGPVMFVAAVGGTPTVLFEPNAEPGLTNRLLTPLVTRAAVSYEETQARFGAKAVRTGSPVRKEFFDVPPKEHQLPFTLLIFGGSRGALAINQALMDALDSLSASGIPLRFIHQTGERDYNAVRVAYARREIQADVRPFINDMPACFAEADLVICRAGASTVAELAAAGRAAILVPYPHAAEQHQLRNAEVFVRAGAARLLPQGELTGARLAAAILDLLQHPEQLAQMEAAARRLAVPDAAARIADLVESVAR
ncbi:MAG: undecaprenyldiphospho-muramoylpentapeptide beta-N-acetylglucosaminyltransferase [Acidobacteria bacterium]|nr:undecaprenyldiphospho-muramoylpentapeptide beta-N-acetylglucosaminyltransferase [Acidobacteriota bacterium]